MCGRFDEWPGHFVFISSMGGTDPANMLNALGRCGYLLRASYLRASYLRASYLRASLEVP